MRKEREAQNIWNENGNENKRKNKDEKKKQNRRVDTSGRERRGNEEKGERGKGLH